jgi:hypothetical protein
VEECLLKLRNFESTAFHVVKKLRILMPPFVSMNSYLAALVDFYFDLRVISTVKRSTTLEEKEDGSGTTRP